MTRPTSELSLVNKIMYLSILLIILGLVLLIAGASLLVNGASQLAKYYGISDLMIGLTIVACGTSSPELIINTISSLKGQNEIIYGNVIGSNIFNILFILGVVGLILPIKVAPVTIRRDIPISLIVALLAWVISGLSISGGTMTIDRYEGAFLIVCFISYLMYLYKTESQHEQREDVPLFKPNKSKWSLVLQIGGGLVALVLGGNFVIDHAVFIASQMGLSNKVIAITIIAAGTSLPELITSLVAAYRGNSDISIGNVIGSNIFNILFILGGSAIINPIPFNPSFTIDFSTLIIGTILLLISMRTFTRRRLDRWEASGLLMLYFGYLGYQIYFQ